MLAPAAAPSKFADMLLNWYDRDRRDLPWRSAPGAYADPYAVWLSEIMLQQTGVKTVVPYFHKFLALWPNVAALAAARTEEVMQAWAGLGYYSRARNLHLCAQLVARDHAGVFPDSEEALLALPGIGPYTAAAIAAIAFGRRAVVVDGNVERVIARVFVIDAPPAKGKDPIRAAAASVTPRLRPGDFAQAMMDLGATICTPRAPLCVLCPVRVDCRASLLGQAEAFPRKAAKAARPERGGAVFYIRHRGQVLLRQRPPRGLLGGMMEFPGTTWTEDFDSACVDARGGRRVGAVRHIFTHFALTLQVYVSTAPGGEFSSADCRWVDERALDAEALPTLMRKVAALAQERA